MTTDESIFERINALAHEEEGLYRRAGDGSGLDAAERQRLEAIQVELDQCYDFLHQRQGRRDAGQNADAATPRAPEVVERYDQ
jgi:hypothetical protein